MHVPLLKIVARCRFVETRIPPSQVENGEQSAGVELCSCSEVDRPKNIHRMVETSRRRAGQPIQALYYVEIDYESPVLFVALPFLPREAAGEHDVTVRGGNNSSFPFRAPPEALADVLLSQTQ
jgi:hypothetical protein